MPKRSYGRERSQAPQWKLGPYLVCTVLKALEMPSTIQLISIAGRRRIASPCKSRHGFGSRRPAGCCPRSGAPRCHRLGMSAYTRIVDSGRTSRYFRNVPIAEVSSPSVAHHALAGVRARDVGELALEGAGRPLRHFNFPIKSGAPIL
jgi:hypothetical protein